jgi:hypothetical protein
MSVPWKHASLSACLGCEPFFIHVVHSPSGTVGHVAAPKLTSARRRDSESMDMWQRWSSPRQGGEVRGHGTRGSAGAYLYREVWTRGSTEANGHVVAPELISAQRRGPRP